MGIWFFSMHRKGGLIDNPIQSAFFQNDELGSLGALVREGIQNALDEKLENAKEVRVRIAIMCDEQHSVEQSKLSNFIAEPLLKHIGARSNGLREENVETVLKEKPCSYLVFEDFNTKGLTGDADDDTLFEGVGNNFLNFFRGIAVTNKGGEQQKNKSSTNGKWGVGKDTFWIASKIRTIFGFTIPNDSPQKPLLMGRTILQLHALDSDRKEYRDGYYGEKDPDSDLMLPIKDEDIHSSFCKLFQLKRTDESGLSIVVPFITDAIKNNDTNKNNKITLKDDLIFEIINNYFYPILMNELIVEIKVNGTEEIILNSINIAEEIEKIYEATEGPDFKILKDFVNLATEMISLEDTAFHAIDQDKLEKLEWSSGIFEDSKLQDLIKAFNQWEPIFLMPNILVTPKTGDPIKSNFKIALIKKRDYDDQGSSRFIRQDISILPKKSSLIALTVIRDRPLADFLGKAEGPAHIDWDARKVSAEYEKSPKLLSFVRSGPNELYKIFSTVNNEEDFNLFAPYYPVGTGLSPRPPNGISKPSKVDVEKIDTGFKISQNANFKYSPDVEMELVVSVAYDTNHRSAPLTKYNQADFNLQRMKSKSKGLKNLDITDNKLSAQIKKRKFNLEITGFDQRRDLHIYADIVKRQNGS